MTLNQFNSLSKNEKIVTICNYGVYLGNRTFDNKILSYYEMDALFVELVYVEGDNKIKEVRSCVLGKGLN